MPLHASDDERLLTRVFRRVIQADFRADSRARLFVSVLALAVLPTLLAVWLLVAPNVWEYSPLIALGVGIVLVAAQVVCAWLSLSRPAGTGSLIQALAEAEIEREKANENLDLLLSQTKYLNLIQSWTIDLHAAVASVERFVSTAALIDRVLGPVAADPKAFFALGDSDLWTLAVFIHEKESDLLTCVWRKSDPRHPAHGREARQWRPGVGHVGQTFSLQNDENSLITDDTSAPEVEAIFRPGGDNQRADDAALYRSFASYRFGRQSEGGPFLGVIVATSNRAHSFSQATALPLRHGAAVLTSLAGHLTGRPAV
jgi:hypothetical protein